MFSNHACQIEADSCEIVSGVVGKIKFAKFVADIENWKICNLKYCQQSAYKREKPRKWYCSGKFSSLLLVVKFNTRDCQQIFTCSIYSILSDNKDSFQFC